MKRTRWYQDALIYQVYPRSFYDSNGDGIGDLRGILAKLDYLKALGIDAIWLSPVFDSPNDDNGYDIRNYRDIAAEFGTLDDWKALKAAMKQKGIRLIMDFVGNHTSDEHPWFQAALQDPKSPYRSYYFFRDGRGHRPPNNWTGFFGDGAWQKEPNGDQYYLRLFTKKQPDVNWDNPEVRAEFKAILNYWIDLGVDGFRCDVITIISKDQQLPNGKKRIGLTGREHFINGPRVHEYLQELSREVFGPSDCMTVGESVLMSVEQAPLYVGEARGELDMLFSFEHMDVDSFGGIKWFLRPFSLPRLKKILAKWQIGLHGKGWNSLYWENHDQPRSLGRFHTCDHEYRTESAKMLAVAMYFHQGTPYVYQGQELGMTNAPFKELQEYQDTETHSIYQLGRKLHLPNWYLMKAIRRKSRDHARTPMQWDLTDHAGFTTGTPWLKVNPNYQEINVAAQENDPASVLHFYRKLFQVRKTLPIVRKGDYHLYAPLHRALYLYGRTSEEEALIVAANFSKKMQSFEFPEEFKHQPHVMILGTYDSEGDVNQLRPYEARVYHFLRTK